MLKDQLKNDQKEALKSGNAKKRMVIGMVLNSVKNRELDKRTKLAKTESDPVKLDQLSQLNDEETLEVISSEIKKRKDSIESFKAGGREELAQGEKEEVDMLMSYMPEQLPEARLREEVKKTIAETGAKDAKDMGKVIGAVMAKVKGKADGTLVSRIVKEELPK